jgi:hypothetical protein
MRPVCALMACSLVLISVPLQAQQLAGGGGAEVSVWRVLAALIVSVAAAAVLAVVLRSRAMGRPTKHKWLSALARPGRIELVETRRIASLTELSLVRCDGTEYLILSSQGAAEVLERRPLPGTGQAETLQP